MQLTTNRHFRIPAFTVLAAILAMGGLALPRGMEAQAATAQAPINTYNATHHPVVGRNGMVATQNFLATQIGVDILRQGGNAVDAGVAVGLALAVTLPRAGNVGGGGFILVHLAEENRTVVIDFRETAPAAAYSDMFFGEDGEVDNEEYRFSHKSSAIPASVAGFDHLLAQLRHHELARGRPTRHRTGARRHGRVGGPGGEPRPQQAPAQRQSRPRGPSSTSPTAPTTRSGDLYRQPDLAWTLEQIAEGGADAFYEGEIARRIAADMAKHNGLITMEDLANYRVTEREPVRGTFRGYDIAAMSAPSSGGMHIVQMLNIFENFPLQEMGYGSADAMHVMAESMKLAYADRSKYLGDPDYLDLPVAALTSKDYAAELARGISLSSARPSSDVGPGNLAPYESPETTHYSVLDSEGNALVNTYTLMFSYGSGVVIDGTGILMNNNLGNFTLRPDIPDAFGLMGSADNQIAAGRRPVSSMTPIIVLRDGRPFLLTGSPGGSRIITTNLQLLVNVLEHGMNIADATARPRMHHQWYPDRLEVESGFSPDVIRLLRARGHDVQFSAGMGSLQTVMFSDGLFYGYGDPRRPGAMALGY